MIGIRHKPPKKDENHELHRLLGALFSMELSDQEKLAIFEQEYDICMNEDFRKEVSEMCNLSQGIREEGIREGIQEGIQEAQRKQVYRMHEKNYYIDEIADIIDLNHEQISKILKEVKTIKCNL